MLLLYLQLANISCSSLKEQLDHAMSVAPGDWKGKIEAHARNLMRMLSADGQPIYNTFEKVLDQVLADIKADTEIQRQKALDAAEAAKNGKIKITVAPKETGLALPKAVVEEGRLATETALREVCVVDD